MAAIRLNIPKAEIDKLSKTIGAYAQALGKDANVELLRQGQLLVKDLIKTTPPKKQSSGKKRVAKDINKAIRLVDPDKTTDKELKHRMKEIARQRDYQAADAIHKGSSKFKDLKFMDFSPKVHREERKKGGITYSVPNPTNKATFEKREHRDYTRKIQDNVGKLKASWLPAANKLMVKTAKWISKHAAHAYSVASCDVRVDEKTKTPTIYIRNRELAQALLYRAAKSALNTRQKNMMRDLTRRIQRFMVNQAKRKLK